MKRAVSVVFAIFILCLAGIMLAPSFIDFSVYKEQAVREVETRTGLTLQINGDVEFTILPAPRFSVSDVSVRAPEGSKREYLAQFARLDVHVALAPLFQGQVSVSSVTLVKPVIALEMLESGQLNVLTEEIQTMLSPKEAKGSSSSAVPAISLDKIRIKDGAFSYLDHKIGSDVTIQNINTDLSAQSLLGPYQAQGSLFYDGYALNFEFESDAYDAENKILSPKIKLALQPGDLILEFGGVANLTEEFSVQGQTSLRIENIGQTLSRYGVQNVNGLNTTLETKGLLSADATKLDYKNFDVQLGQDKASGSVRIDFAPLKYSISLKSTGDINFEEVVKGLTPFKKGSFDLAFFGNAAEMTLKKTTLKLDKHVFNVSGDYKANNKTGRSEIGLNIKSALIDYDEIVTGLPKASSSKQSVRDMILSLALPVDLALDLSADKVIWQKKNISGLGLSAKFSRNAVTLSDLSVKNIAGASLKASGAIKNIGNASGITAYIDMKSPDIHKVAQWFSINSDEWPKNLKKANVKAKFSGAIDLMDVTANISAMGGEVIARGKVSKALENPAINDLVLQIKHRNMSDAVKILTGAALNDKSLKKSLDIYARVNQSGQRYSLKEIKGDMSGISVQGDVDLNLVGSVPKLKGNLVFGTVNLASIMTPSGKKGSSSQKSGGGSNSARWSKSPIDTSGLHAMNIDLALRAKKIEYGAWPLIKPALTLNLNNGVLKISDLKAGLFGGDINFSTTVQSVAKQRQPVHFESSMSVKNADLGRLSAALLGKKLLKVSGSGNLKMNLKSAGSSPAALVHDLSGQGSITGRNIVLDGIDVERFARALSEDSKTGDTLLGLWNGAKQGGTSQFDTLDGDFTIKEGVVHLNKMDLDGANTAIETKNGIIHLPNWTLATKHKIIVKGIDGAPSDVPPFEISFSGSLDNPAQTFGQGLLQDYLNRKIQRKLNKFLSDKLGLPSNDSNPPSGAPQNASNNSNAPKPKNVDIEDAAEDAIRGILEGLLR